MCNERHKKGKGRIRQCPLGVQPRCGGHESRRGGAGLLFYSAPSSLQRAPQIRESEKAARPGPFNSILRELCHWRPRCSSLCLPCARGRGNLACRTLSAGSKGQDAFCAGRAACFTAYYFFRGEKALCLQVKCYTRDGSPRTAFSSNSGETLVIKVFTVAWLLKVIC